jgi:SET domain-containing protein
MRDQDDYASFLDSLEVTEEDMRDVIYRTDDVLDYEMPLPIIIAKSEIHGFGMFLMSEASANDVLFPATINGMRTQAGRFINHAIKANTRLVIGRFANYIVSNRTIKSGEELTLNYRDNHQQLSS